MTTQPEALALADILDRSVLQAYADAAAELRRLHDVNTELLSALKWVLADAEDCGGYSLNIHNIAHLAIAKAERTTP